MCDFYVKHGGSNFTKFNNFFQSKHLYRQEKYIFYNIWLPYNTNRFGNSHLSVVCTDLDLHFILDLIFVRKYIFPASWSSDQSL